MTGVGALETDRLRERLVAHGFADDGVRLRGPVMWTHPTDGQMVARVEIEPEERFPFAPPQVRLLDAGHSLDVTFHLDRPRHPDVSGNLCLWTDEWPVDQAPWTDPERLISRIAGWLEETAAGWPDDDVCDLERYLESDLGTLVLYDAEALAGLAGVAVCTERHPTGATTTVTNTTRRVKRLDGRRGLRRGDKNLAWVDDLGEVHRPVRDWDDLKKALGERTRTLNKYITLGAVNLLLLRYQRGGQESALALKVRRIGGGIALWAYESADISTKTVRLRAGLAASELADTKIAIVGCGAIGSFVADILFRSGVRNLTLIDPERLRPGNVVRHLAGFNQLGQWKAAAVRQCLASVDLDISTVQTRVMRLTTVSEGTELLRHNQVVVDATASAQASSLLRVCADISDLGNGHVVVSVCAQREGDIVRVDRFPTRADETHLRPLQNPGNDNQLREYGCGNPVSATSPAAVIDAAELACRVAIDEATRSCTTPASLVDVRAIRPTSTPFTRLGLHTPGTRVPNAENSA